MTTKPLTNGRAYATALQMRPSVCDVTYCG